MRTSSRLGSSAVTVAVRGPPSSSAISPKKSPRAERVQALAVTLNPKLAGYDHEHLAAAVALRHQAALGGNIDLVSKRTQPLQVLPAEGAEQRDSVQQVQLFVASHAGLLASSVSREDTTPRRAVEDPSGCKKPVPFSNGAAAGAR